MPRMFSSDRRKNSFVIILVCSALLAVCTNIAVVYSQGTEIKYDDGSAETSWTWTRYGLGGMFAVRFTPPYTPCLLTEARYYIDEAPAAFVVCVLDSNKNNLLPTLKVTPGSKGWYDVDLLNRLENLHRYPP